jgi:thiamine monophosphate kinase
MTQDRSLDPDDVVAWLGKLWPSSGHPEIVAGVDEDDCAVLSLKEQLLVVTTDFLNASPIALQLGIGDLYDLGRLLVDVNLADLCGSGAKPAALLTAITME